jgi:hypothetical protein
MSTRQWSNSHQRCRSRHSPARWTAASRVHSFVPVPSARVRRAVLEETVCRDFLCYPHIDRCCCLVNQVPQQARLVHAAEWTATFPGHLLRPSSRQASSLHYGALVACSTCDTCCIHPRCECARIMPLDAHGIPPRPCTSESEHCSRVPGGPCRTPWRGR